MERKDVEDACAVVANNIQDELPDGMGFVLIVAGYKTGFISYMSSTDAEDTIDLLRDMADRLVERRKLQGGS